MYDPRIHAGENMSGEQIMRPLLNDSPLKISAYVAVHVDAAHVLEGTISAMTITEVDEEGFSENHYIDSVDVEVSPSVSLRVDPSLVRIIDSPGPGHYKKRITCQKCEENK